MKINNKLILFILMGLTIVACVDDYEDANPAPGLDAPLSVLTVEKDTVDGGETITWSIQVVDAPGGIDSVGYITTDDKGTVTVDESSVNAARGQEEGVITGTFTAPFNAREEFTLTLEVYDMQADDMQKKYTLTEELYIEPAFDDATITDVTASDGEVSLGESTTLFIEIEAPANINNVRVFASAGSVELVESSLNAAIGETSAIVEAIYTAPEAPSEAVGPVEILVFVEDELQEVEVSESFEPVSVVYAEDVPSITINSPDEGNASVEATVDITAPGVIDTVIVNAYQNDSETAVGMLSYDIEDLIGETGGTFDLEFYSASYIGYVDIEIMVIDEQGAVSTETKTVLIQPCPISLEDVYTSNVSAMASDSCAVGSPIDTLSSTIEIEATDMATIYEVEDITGGAYASWYENCVEYSGGEAGEIRLNCNDFSVEVRPFEDSFGATLTGSGVYTPGTGVIVISWQSDSGASGTTTFTPE